MTFTALALILAFALRLLGALLRPAWVDEAASAIFSSGNSSWYTPMNTLVPLDDFVVALRLQRVDQFGEALRQLHLEDNHPPLHFGLTFLSAQLLQPPTAVIDPLTARLPAVIAGSLAIPLIIAAVQSASGSALAARRAGLILAVSPLAVALGLEARHYAIATTMVCGALWAVAEAWRRQAMGRDLGALLVTLWLFVNGLGVLSHHLFVLCIAAQLVCVVILCWNHRARWAESWLLMGVPALSLLLAMAWLHHVGAGGAADQTDWLALDRANPGHWIALPIQLLVTSLTALLAPGTALGHLWQWPLLVAAGLATAIGLINLVRIQRRAGSPEPLLLVFTLSSMGVLLAASVLSGKDFTRALRYGFAVLPGLVGLVAVATAQVEVSGRSHASRALLGCSLICSLGVASGVALPASYNPELLLKKVSQQSSDPIVIVFSDRLITHGRPLIGYEGLSIAWQLQSRPQHQLKRRGIDPRLMLLGGKTQDRAQGLAAISGIKPPFDLWVINAHGTRSPTISRSDCRHLGYDSAGGHLHDHYHCGSKAAS